MRLVRLCWTDGPTERLRRSGAIPANGETPAAAPLSLLQKAALVLDALGDATGTLGLSELARRCGVAKSTVHRLCGELVDWGVVQRSGDGFQLGPKLYELGAKVPGHRRVRDLALPYLQELLIETGHIVHLAVDRGKSNFYLEKLELHSAPTDADERGHAHRAARVGHRQGGPRVRRPGESPGDTGRAARSDHAEHHRRA